MNNSFKKNLIAASVGAVLAAGSFAANAGTPGTSNLLFPYVTTATGSYTFISIVAQNGTAVPTPVHFTYAMKATSAANSATCTHLNGDATMTANDLMQFEIQNKVNMATTFGDTTSVPKYFPNTAAAANQHGILIVNNNAGGAYGSGATYVDANLYGEARIISTATGLAAGYSSDDLHTTAAANPNFALAAGPDGAVSTKVISWFPDPTVSSSWFVVPLADEVSMAFNGNVAATYQVRDNTAAFGGHYNNNEGFQSSTATASVTCLGTFDRASLLGPLNAPWSANGGWGNFVGTVGAANSLIYKMESTSALGGATSFITREPVL
jgi:hypothetical protein